MRGQAVEALVNEVVLRAQAQAEYSHENYGHFGLNLRRYAHFTSPIRRYADLIVHRALIRALNLGPDGLNDMRAGELAQIAEHISAAERRAMAAERETVDRVIAAHLADRVGAIFAGRIAGVTRVGLFVKLNETGADGFIPPGPWAMNISASRRPTARSSGRGPKRRFGWAARSTSALSRPLHSPGRLGSRSCGRHPSRARTKAGRVRTAQADLQGQASMNDMSRIWRIPTPPPDRSLREAMTRGFLGRCPACGRGRLFRSYLKVVNACEVCGEPLSGHRADDAPAYITLLIVAHAVGAGILMSDEIWPNSSLVWVAVFWLAVTMIGESPHLASGEGGDRRPAMGPGHARVRVPSQQQHVIEQARPGRALRPRDAATLILVERSERGTARVLMGKRHAGHRFMPGKFVFPGGRVEPEDRRMAAAGALDPAVEEKLNARVRRPSPGFARALALAAIRETFEETGLAVGFPAKARPKNRRPAPGPASRRQASILRSTPSTSLPARSLRPGARGASTPASSSSTPASSPCASMALFILRRNWSNSSGRRLTTRETSICPRSPTQRSTTSRRRSKAASTSAGRAHSIARSEERDCANSFSRTPG